MDTRQLLSCMEHDKILVKYATGVHPANKLPKLSALPSCFIANTDTANKKGSHWIAVFIGADGIGEYFDTYGRPPRRNFDTYMKKYCKNVMHNDIRVQGPLSSTCGQFCMYYLCNRVRGRLMNSIVGDFSSDLIENDISIAEYVKRHFNIDVQAYELTFVLSQICKSEK